MGSAVSIVGYVNLGLYVLAGASGDPFVGSRWQPTCGMGDGV